MKYTFYIDESGNTGTDWLNNSQPYFVYGGWLINNLQIHNAEKYLKEISSHMQSKELKSKNLFKHKNGESYFYDLFIKMCSNFNAIPIFRFIDKKFMISAKIVETFFDPAYNPFLNWSLTAPIELKKALATCIMEDESILIEFSDLIKNCTISLNKMEYINKKLIYLFESQGHTLVAKALKHLKQDNLIEMIDEFEWFIDNNQKNRLTLTGTTLITLLNCAEIICNGNGEINIIHDKLRGYDGAFSEINDIFLNNDNPTILGTEDKWILSNFPHINSITMADSKNELLIQSADLLCGFIYKIFKNLLNDNTLSKQSITILNHLVTIHDLFISLGIKIWDYNSTYNFETKLISSINPSHPSKNFNYHNLVNKEFKKAIKINL